MKETLEEELKKKIANNLLEMYEKGFAEGAEWQKKRMYSEEEVEFIKTLIDFYWSNYNNEHPNNLKDFELTKRILETFKKK